MARDGAARPEARAVRLFLAVEIPDEARSVIAGAIAPLRETYARARWVPQENWHVTLKFLGSTSPALVTWVEETSSAVAGSHPPIRTKVSGLGAFPGARRGRVLWAGLDDTRGELSTLARALDDALAKEFRSEMRAYAPHVTVARSEPPLNLPEGWTDPPAESARFTIGQVVLFRSHLQRPAPRYEPLAMFPLGG